jgi:hypothetical protein
MDPKAPSPRYDVAATSDELKMFLEQSWYYKPEDFVFRSGPSGVPVPVWGDHRIPVIKPDGGTTLRWRKI